MNTRLKRIAFSAAIILAFCVLLCTIASRTIYNLLLPRVETTFSSSGSLKSTLSFNGVFTAAEPIKIKNDTTLPIKEFLVKQDDFVAEGDALFTVDTASIEASIRQFDINIQRQKNDMNSGLYTGGDVLVKQMELDAMQVERNILASKLPKGGNLIKAATNGIIDFVNIDKSKDEILYIYPENSSLNIEFTANITDLSAIKSDKSELSVAVPVSSGKDKGVIVELIDAKPSKAIPNSYVIKVCPTSAIDAQLGESAALKLSTNSQVYDCTLPLSAVNQGIDSSYVFVLAERQSLWGIENYVQKTIVTVTDSNYSTAAVRSDTPLATQKIIQYTSKPLKDGEVVFVG